MQMRSANIKNLETQGDAVLYFLERLDIEMIDSILDDQRTYQDLPKAIFIQKLGKALQEFAIGGDSALKRHRGFCNSEVCNNKCTGYSFVGNSTSNYLDLIIDIQDGEVHDMYECVSFQLLGRDILKNERITIDKFDAPMI